jgi:hypothetical protein
VKGTPHRFHWNLLEGFTSISFCALKYAVKSVKAFQVQFSAFFNFKPQNGFFEFG